MAIIATQGKTMFTMLKKLKLSKPALSTSSLSSSISSHLVKPSRFQKLLFAVFLLIGSVQFSTKVSADIFVGGCLVPEVPSPLGANCTSMNLDWQNFFGMDLSDSDFSDSSFVGANLENTDLSGVNFTGANLSNANFGSATNFFTIVADGTTVWSNTICPNGTNSNQYVNDGNGCLGTFSDDDGDGVRNSDDAFPTDDDAYKDTDSDGYPDSFNPTCTPACQSVSLLDLDMFPFNNAAALDADKDGFPESWNDGTGGTFNCNVTCQINSGLAIDAGQHAAGAIFVDASKPWAGATGLSWGTAWPTVRDALAVATPGQEIWIAKGVYYPDKVGVTNSNAATDAFVLVDQVALVGGFVGGETMASEADPEFNPTVLSGDITQDDTFRDINGVHYSFETSNNHNGTNSHLIVNSSSVIARLTGLIISGGGSGIAGNSAGGGIYCVSTKLTLQKVKMFYNRAISTGGAISCHNSNTKLILQEVQIDNSYVGTEGGGINVNNGGQLEVYNSSITNNKANLGGGINLSNGSKAIIVNSTIAYNTANVGGGIVVHGSGTISGPKNLSMSFTTLAFNNATVSDAGGMRIYNTADVEVKGSIIVGNTAVTAGAGNIHRTSTDVFSAQYTRFGHTTDGQLFLVGNGPVDLATFITGGSNPTVSIPSSNVSFLINPSLSNLGSFSPLLFFPSSSSYRNAIPLQFCEQIPGATRDQRGHDRPYYWDGSDCDMGAFELNDFDLDEMIDDFDPDIDGDGMSNDFENTYGLNPYYPGDATLDPDSDGAPNNMDDFPNNAAASVDSDGDGAPDFFNPSCDITCQSTSGLNPDMFPNHVAASVDSDADGFPESWNPGCIPSCQSISGLVLDAGQLYVDVNTPTPYGTANGLTWNTAFPNPQDALAVATQGQEIWIAEGVYYPDRAAGGDTDASAATFALANQVYLLGGFVGGETLRSDANPVVHKVIFSGDITQNDTNVVGGVHTQFSGANTHNTPNSHVIVTASSVISRIEGVIISGGGSASAGNENGGGIKCNISSLYLKEVKLVYNRAINYGGAIYCSNGGGTHQVVLEDVLIDGNYAGNSGGGIYLQSGVLDIQRSTIAYNTAANEGGGINQNDSKSSISNSTIAYNTAGLQGGGINIVGSGVITGQKYLAMNFSTVAFNQASAWYGGGLMTSNYVDAEINGSVFVGNTSPSNGGNVYRSNSDVFEADFSSFGSASAGGLSLQGSNATITTFLTGGFNPTVTIPTVSTVSLINSTLMDHGGFTPMLSFPNTSEYRNAIPTNSNCIQFMNHDRDQRHFPRPNYEDFNQCDIGAFEMVDYDNDSLNNDVDSDDDNDGMPDSYEQTYSFNSYFSGDASMDADSDTLTNFQEFSMGRNPLVADNSEAEKDLMISPRYHRYGFETTPATCQTMATPVTYTITNKDPVSSRTFTGAIHFNGGTDWELNGPNTCTGTINPNSSCTFQVVYCGDGVGNSAGIISVPTNDAETPTLTSALFDYESDKDEAERRVPPVLTELVITRISDSHVVTDGIIEGGAAHTFQWTIAGYHPDYQSLAAVFNCHGTGAGSCGRNYSLNFDNSGMLNDYLVDVGTWTYNGIAANTYTFTTTFTLPYNAGQSNLWVLRFYQNPLADIMVGNPSLSLTIPGDILPNSAYYDTSGRRLVLNVVAP